MFKMLAAGFIGYYIGKYGFPQFVNVAKNAATEAQSAAAQVSAAAPGITTAISNATAAATPASSTQPTTSTTMGWKKAVMYGQNALPAVEAAQPMGWWNPGRMYMNY